MLRFKLFAFVNLLRLPRPAARAQGVSSVVVMVITWVSNRRPEATPVPGWMPRWR